MWTFHAGTASATLHVADDSASMHARWLLHEPDGDQRLWMNLRFTRRR